MIVPYFLGTGMFEGSGEYSVGTDSATNSRAVCRLQVHESPTELIVEGQYSDGSLRMIQEFEAHFQRVRWPARMATVEYQGYQFGQVNGVVSVSDSGGLIQAESNSHDVRLCMDWDEEEEELCFRFHGIVQRNGKPPAYFSVVVRKVDPESIRSNVVFIKDSSG